MLVTMIRNLHKPYKANVVMLSRLDRAKGKPKPKVTKSEYRRALARQMRYLKMESEGKLDRLRAQYHRHERSKQRRRIVVRQEQ